MNPIQLMHGPDRPTGSASVELRPGAYSGGQGHRDSVFLSEEVFGYVEPFVAGRYPGLNPYGPSTIRRSIWRLIVTDLRQAAQRVREAGSIADVRAAGVRFSEADLDRQFEEDLGENVIALAALFAELANWLDSRLEQHEAVSVLGL